MVVLGNMHLDSKIMEVIVIEHHMPISHSPRRRSSKGPLPSGYTSFDMDGENRCEGKYGKSAILHVIT